MRVPAARAGVVAAVLALASALPATAVAHRPQIRSLHVRPASLGFAGGQVRLTSTVRGASRCYVSLSPRVAGASHGTSCRRHEVTLPPNRSTSAVDYTLTLSAIGAHGHRMRRTLRVPVAGSVQLAAGEAHACALEPPGRVYCWGENTYGQLGYAKPAKTGLEHEYARAHEVRGVRGAVQITAGAYFTCALLKTGHVDCWGSAANGELGEPMTEATNEPAQVQGITDAVAVSAGAYHACALERSGTVLCWGENTAGELGDGMSGQVRVAVPVAVKNLAGVAEIATGSAGGESTCARLVDGHVECWGDGEQGQLGYGPTSNSSTPVRVARVTGARRLAAGSEFACAIIARGRVDCWGVNDRGQLGDGIEGQGDLAAPVRAVGVSGAVDIAAGYGSHACAVVAAGAVDCWGWNRNGQLGRSGVEKSATPAPVPGLTHVAQLAVGESFTCAMKFGGSVSCWGQDQLGQLGDGTLLSPSEAHPAPTAVEGEGVPAPTGG